MNVLAINANIAPSNRLAIPKIGKWGFGPPEISFPSESKTSGFSDDFFVAKYSQSDTTPEIKNKTPMAIVIHSNVCSRYSISNIPIIIAHIPRKKELWSIFINILVLCKVTKNS